MLKSATVYDRLDALIAAAKANEVSLAVFRPTRVLDFVWENEDREWDPAKVFDAFVRTDLHFFLGTTQQFHFVAPNPWVIVGVFPIPHEGQPDLFEGGT